MPAELVSSLTGNRPDDTADISWQNSGIILLDNTPLLAVCLPIVTSHGDGPSTGTITLGYFLDTVAIQSLADTTHLSITMLPLNSTDLPDELISTIESRDNTKTTFVQTLNKQSIAGYSIIKDIDGNPAFVFKVDMPREIYAQGQKTLAWVHIALFFFAVVFFLVLVLVVNKTVVDRITMLSKSVNKIRTEADTSTRITVPGNDEIVSLANNINGMLTTLEKSGATLRSQKEFIDRILANTANAVLVVDSSQTIILVNAAFNKMFGFVTEDIQGKIISDIQSLRSLSKEIKTYLDSNTAESKAELQIKSGTKNNTLSITFNRMKEDQLYVIALTDITSEREKQARLYLTDRLASVGKMASGIAHELNNPLTSIIGLSELLKDEELPDSVKEDVATVNDEALRAANIVQKMLSFARMHESIKQPVQINEVIADVINIRSYDQKLNNINVEYRLKPDLPKIMADYFQLQQVFLNILLNAEQVMAESHGKGNLIITTELLDENIRISLADDGPGIDEQNLNRIFDPFFTTKEVGDGTGLGLSVCYGIITAHNGRIYARSETGKGATFIVELPLNLKVKEGI